MPVRYWIRFTLVALVFWPVVAHAQSSALTDAYDRHSELYDQGHYQQAFPFAEKALKLSEQEFGPDHPTTATALNNLAEL